MRPNERFSGRNHPRHLCRDCAHLPAEEREYRQGEGDIERLLHDGLYVPRRRRAQFNRFLDHPNARVRDLARRILAEQRREAATRPIRDEYWESDSSTRSPSPGSPARRASDDGGTGTWERDRAQDHRDDDDPF